MTPHRNLRKASTVVSLTICVAVLALWTRSHFVMDRVSWMSGMPAAPATLRSLTIVSAGGRMSINWGSIKLPSFDPGQQARWEAWRAKVGPTTVGFTWHRQSLPALAKGIDAFALEHNKMAIPTAWSTAAVSADEWDVRWPHWLPTFLSAIVPAWAATRRFRKYRQPMSGRCRTCGYDLRPPRIVARSAAHPSHRLRPHDKPTLPHTCRRCRCRRCLDWAGVADSSCRRASADL